MQNYCYGFNWIVQSRTRTLSKALYVILFIYKLNQIGDKTKPLLQAKKGGLCCGSILSLVKFLFPFVLEYSNVW